MACSGSEDTLQYRLKEHLAINAGVDLGFYKGGCLIHLKWAPGRV